MEFLVCRLPTAPRDAVADHYFNLALQYKRWMVWTNILGLICLYLILSWDELNFNAMDIRM